MPEHSGTAGAHSLAAGDLVLLDYELWAEGGGKTDLIDTTRNEVAQEAHLTVPAGYEFGPRPHLLGGDDFPAAIEKAVLEAPTGQEVEKEFPPAEAFGERDPKLIELFSMHEIERLPEMRREDAKLDIGTVLTIRGRRGRVASYTAARVRVDFNPPFAGRKVRAKFKVVEPVVEPVAKAKALIELTYGRGKDFQVEIHDKVLSIQLPDRAKFDLAWHAAAKSRLIERLRTQLNPKSIRFVEEYVTPSPKPEKKAAETKSEAKGEAKTAAAGGTTAESKGDRPRADSGDGGKTSHRHAPAPAPAAAKE
jgi:FKBP-type peptidyl-prolyl cis-trans isomerase 2